MPSSGERASLSIPQRKLARVLPEPVGAQISALSPPEIASQPPACAGVGPSKEASNQRRTGALNGASGSDFVLDFALAVNPSILRTQIVRQPFVALCDPKDCRNQMTGMQWMAPGAREGFSEGRRRRYGVPPANFT